MTDFPTSCPVHAPPDPDVLNAWCCPDDCEHFHRELQRRINDVKINGNFYRIWSGDDGLRWKQQFRNYQPVGEPTLLQHHGSPLSRKEEQQ